MAGPPLYAELPVVAGLPVAAGGAAAAAAAAAVVVVAV